MADVPTDVASMSAAPNKKQGSEKSLPCQVVQRRPVRRAVPPVRNREAAPRNGTEPVGGSIVPDVPDQDKSDAFDEDVVSFDPHGEGLQRDHCRQRQRAAGRHVEQRAVARAHDAAAV